MAVLSWKDVAFDPINVGQGNVAAAGLFSGALGGLSESLGRFQAQQAKEAGVAGIRDAMKLTTADAYRQAAKNGQLEINETNIDFFTNREKELLANEQAGVLTQGYKLDNQGKLVDMEGKRVQIEGWKIDNQGKIIDNKGKVIGNDKAALELEDSQYGFQKKKETDAAKLEVAPILAQIAQAGNRGDAEGRRIADDLAVKNAALMAKADIPLADIDGISDETLNRLTKGGAAAKTIDDNTEAARLRTVRDKGKELFQNFYNNNHYATYEDAVAALRKEKADPDVIAEAESHLTKNREIMYPVVDPEKDQLEQELAAGIKPRTSAPSGGVLSNLITGTESANKLNALFGQAQDKDSPYRGVDVSRMTIGQLDQMAPEYGNYVAARNNGVTATPMGLYQIVNTTLQQAAKEMGLSPDTVFDADTQTKIYHHLVEGRIGGPRTMQAKLDGMRKEWAGLNGVSDSVLASAITAYEGGDKGALDSMLGQNVDATTAAAAADPQILENGILAAAQKGNLNPQMNKAVVDLAKQRDNNASQLIQQVTLDNNFDAGKAGVLQAFLDPANATKKVDDIAEDIKQAYKDIGPDVPDEKAEETASSGQAEIRKAVDVVIDKYRVSPAVALQLVKGASAAGGVLDFTSGNFTTNYNKIDDYVKSVLNLKGNTPQERVSNAMATLQEQAAKSTGVQNLQKLQSQYAEAMGTYYSVAKRAREGGKVDPKVSLERMMAIGRRLEEETKRIQGSASTTANIAALGRVDGR